MVYPFCAISITKGREEHHPACQTLQKRHTVMWSLSLRVYNLITDMMQQVGVTNKLPHTKPYKRKFRPAEGKLPELDAGSE